MIKIAIIEDEPLAARNIERMLLEIDFEIQIIMKIESVADAIRQLPKLDLDLILMDIHLTDGSSFQIFEQIKVAVPIIFTTAFDQYTLKAFKQNSIDYLLKPIDKTELKQAIQKYKNLFEIEVESVNESVNQHYESLMALFIAKNNYKKRFLVKLGKKMKPIQIEEVAYFFVKEKTTYLQTFEDKTYLIDDSLSQLEEQLNPKIFYRPNRQFILSNQSIVDLYYLSTTRIKINLNPPIQDDIFVSIDKIGKFKKWLNQ